MAKKKEVIKGYKAFNINDKGEISCRGVTFKVGKWYHMPKGKKISLCQSGFHFCQSGADVYNYYPFTTGTVVGEIEAKDVSPEKENDSKRVCGSIRVVKLLGLEGFNTGNSNTGHSNTGNSNTGNSNTGHSNTGNSNTGNYNTGYYNTGNSNTGHSNTGNSNTGNDNTGNYNTGNDNTGDYNTGYYNTGNYHTGYFGIGEAPVYMFGEPTKYDRAVLGQLIHKIDFSLVTKYRLKSNPEYMVKKCWKLWYLRATPNQRKLFTELPNFSKKYFYEMSGLKID